jgi:LCP family protein required for cell wall assembly
MSQLTPKPLFEDINDNNIGIPADSQPTPTSTMDSSQHIINILLLGLDQDYKSYAHGGGDYHTDAIIVLAVNFDKNTVDMISLPRDTFTNVPGIKGIYKLNAAINCGGGKTEDGFKKVSEAASWMLGGISVDYYYAFELDTVIEIGDMIGGVDFNVDMSYKGSSGTYYQKGMQHLDGMGIYDYMRVRKQATVGGHSDVGRMNRCKAMLKAIFQKLKSQNMLTQLPSLLGKVNEGLYTNTSLQQSIALANYAYNNINTVDVGSYTMEGSIRSALSWNFYFIDQDSRIKLIKDIYGIDVPKQEYVSYEYANWLGEYGFKAIRYLTTAYELSQYVQEADVKAFNSEQQDSYNALKEAYKQTQTAYNTAALTLDENDNNVMKSTMDNLKKSAEAFAKLVDYQNKLTWTVKSAWYEDPCINEVDVNFQ